MRLNYQLYCYDVRGEKWEADHTSYGILKRKKVDEFNDDILVFITIAVEPKILHDSRPFASLNPINNIRVLDDPESETYKHISEIDNLRLADKKQRARVIEAFKETIQDLNDRKFFVRDILGDIDGE